MSQPHYTRFSYNERIILANRLANGEKPSKIAAALNRPRCTIYREIARNGKPNKNKRTRVNKPALAKLDARHFRGTVKSEEIKRARNRYRQRKKQFKQNYAKYEVLYAEIQLKSRYRTRVRLLSCSAFAETKEYVLKNLTNVGLPSKLVAD